ncbi:restriction endonuclease subunit S [Clostridium sp. KNHs205]|jgi:type I restriction enzyme, S subunit|uniref:restriction endonuclease subunit S n=1 Tax=Clostridium sp. KNHs205 TaxID=1449050 RepID=UPI00051BAC2F|nr:restriction endonuclease subunit S [Clostridium sp. KNHs205]
MTAQDLKNSILQLAIQGKLVEQRAEEGTAKELLEQIKTEKERLINEKKIKKEKPLSEITEDEIPFEIPESWEWVRLNEIYNFIDYRGKTPNKIDEGVVLITASNVRKGYLDFSKSDFISENEYKERMTRGITRKGDLLFTTEAPLGYVAVNTIEIASCGQRVITFQQYGVNVFCNELMCYFIQSPFFQNELLVKATGTTAKGIKAEKLKYLLIPVPPLEEQQRIIAKIEDILPYIEQYDKAYSKLEVFNKKFPEDMQKSILQYAIQGKLVEQRQEEGTAEELYEQIQAEKERLIKEGKIKKEKPLSEFTEEEIPYEIPDSWKWVKLGDVFQINPRNSIEDKIEVSFIPMTLLQEGYVSKFTFEIKKWGDVKKGFTHFKDNDIIFAKITPCFQNLKSAIMENLKNGYGAGTTELHVLRCYKMLSLEYFLWFVKSPYFMSFCEANMSGTAGQQRVGTDIVKNVLLPLPPLEEQKRIVYVIEKYFPFCQQLRK